MKKCPLELKWKNLSGVKAPGALRFKYWMEKTLEHLKKEKLIKKIPEGKMEMQMIKSAKIKEMNAKYRGKDKVTDVLSFSFMNGDKFPGKKLIGQILIDPITARKQAKEHDVSWRAELEFLFVHAVLHVFGFDHENAKDFKKMFGIQAQIMPNQKFARMTKQIYQEYFGKEEV